MEIPGLLETSQILPPLLTSDFPNGSMVKGSSCNAGDTGLIPEWGRSPGRGDGKILQDSYLGSHMDRGVWQAIQFKGSERIRPD